MADIQEKEGPVQIERLTQQRYVKVTSNLNGVSLGDGAKKAEQIIADQMCIRDRYLRRIR